MSEQSYFCGIDLHKTVIQICVLDGDGQVVEERRIRSASLESGLDVVDYLSQWREGGRFAVEAIGLNRWFVNACQEAGMDIVVVNPGRLNLKMLGRKTDRRDAYEIARRLQLGDIDKNALTYYPSDHEHGVRKLLRTRLELLKVRVKMVNQIRRILAAYRLPVPKSGLYRPKNIELVCAQEMPTPELAESVAALARVLQATQQAIRDLSRKIEEVAKEPNVALAVETLPSVGPLTGSTLIYELGDVHRFKNSKSVACYAGLVPSVSNSADRSHHGPISRRGNPNLRWILGEWAVRLLTKDEQVREWAKPKLRRMHTNKIRTALARRLLIAVWIMLTRGEPFSMQRCLA